MNALPQVFILMIFLLTFSVIPTSQGQVCKNMPSIIEGTEGMRGKYSIIGPSISLKGIWDVKSGGDYSNCDLRLGQFDSCQNCKFINSKLPKTGIKNLDYSILDNALLNFSDYAETSLKNTSFVGAHFTHSHIGYELPDTSGMRKNIDFTGANLTLAHLTHDNWEGSIFRNVILHWALLESSFPGSSLDFSNSDWTNVLVSGGVLDGSNLSNGNFQNTFFIKSNLRDVDFSNSNLNGAIFFETNVDGADFTDAKIDNAIFYHVNLDKTNIQYFNNYDIQQTESDIFCTSHANCNLRQFYTPPLVVHESQFLNWLTNTAMKYSQNEISDDAFVVVFHFLRTENIIKIEEDIQVSDQTAEIPSWFRNNIKWWLQGQISDHDFVSSIEFLVNNGIIHVNI